MKLIILAISVLTITSLSAQADLLSDANKAAATKMANELADKAKDKAKSKASSEVNNQIGKQLNKKLLAEARKNQCSFKSGSDELAPGCGAKSKKLAGIIVDIKKTLQSKNQTGFKFIVSGHTDSSGDAAKNKDLSARRAAVMVKELVAQGVSGDDIEAVGMGSESLLVKPDDTEAKKAKNRRYEVQVRI